MKRLLLLGLSIGMVATSMAQLSYGTKIGQTYYDLHSNSSTGNRLVRNADGSMSATWIEHWDILTSDNQPKPNVRGFGYNHYTPANGWEYGLDGECWEESYGCASSYVGWPEMINLESANGNGKQEFMLNHTPLKMTSRDAIGSGSWGSTSTLDIDLSEDAEGATWPRAVSSGDYVHMVGVLPGTDQDYTDANGVLIPLRYYRSSDGGVSWDIQDGDVFDLIGDIVTTNEVIVNDSNCVANIDTVDFITTDGTWMDTVTTVETIYGYTFTPITSAVDTTVYSATNTLPNGDRKDTTAVILSLIGSDTAFVTYTAYNETTIYDTTYCLVTVSVLDTVQDLHVNSVGGDAYAIHANGANVAVTMGGSGLDEDWVVFISTDNGDNWTRRIVKNNHYNGNPDFIVNTVDGPANSYLINMDNFEVIVDNSGKVHVFCGSDIYTDQGTGGYFTGSDLFKEVNAGMFYWNSDMNDNTARVVAKPDFGGDGDASDYDAHTGEYMGFWTLGWPGASFDDNGNIFLLYSAVAEDVGVDFVNATSGDTLGYYDNYMVYSFDGGTTWCGTDAPINNALDTTPVNIAEDVYGISGSTPIEDDVFPVALPEIVDGNMHFTWQGDYSRPGLALIDDTHPNDNIQYIHYGVMDVSGLTSCASIPPTPCADCEPDGVSQVLANNFNFTLVPNPAKGMVTVSAEEAISNITLVNLFGQTVKDIAVNASKAENVNVSDLAEGVYVVKVSTAKGVATQRLTVTK